MSAWDRGRAFLRVSGGEILRDSVSSERVLSGHPAPNRDFSPNLLREISTRGLLRVLLGVKREKRNPVTRSEACKFK